jgi:hypothetical protein
MGEYYRRDRYNSDTRGYSREEAYRHNDYSNNRRQGDRYQSYRQDRPREHYQERERDAYYYAVDPERSRGHREDGKEWYGETHPRDNTPPHAREERALATERHVDQSKSPVGRAVDSFDTQPLLEPRSDRHRGSQDDYYDAGKPNSQVIFRGLDKEVTEMDVYDFFILELSLISIVTTISLQPRRCR